MRVLIAGATGFIGSAVAARLAADGHDVVGLCRSAKWARRRHPNIEWREGVFRHGTTSEDWFTILKGIDSVVNCAGALQDSARDNLADVHIHGPDSLFAACEETGVRRIVQISAIGAAVDTSTNFMRTKAEGDRRLMERNLDWVVLRPALVVADGVYGGTALIRGLAGFPFVIPLSGTTSPMQTIDIDDLSATVAQCLTNDGIIRKVFALAHPEPIDLANIVGRYRAWLGLKPAPLLRIPSILAAPLFSLGDALGLLGWRAPLRTTTRRQLLEGVCGDPSNWINETGIEPKRLSERLARSPSTVQDRWHARLYFLKPLLIFCLSSIWILSGMIALGPGYSAAVQHLQATGMAKETAEVANLVLSLFDIALGAAILWARWLKPAAAVMAGMSIAYMLATLAIAPHLWLDPLGPAVKIIGLAGLALAVLAMAEER